MRVPTRHKRQRHRPKSRLSLPSVTRSTCRRVTTRQIQDYPRRVAVLGRILLDGIAEKGRPMSERPPVQNVIGTLAETDSINLPADRTRAGSAKERLNILIRRRACHTHTLRQSNFQLTLAEHPRAQPGKLQSRRVLFGEQGSHWTIGNWPANGKKHLMVPQPVELAFRMAMLFIIEYQFN